MNIPTFRFPYWCIRYGRMANVKVCSTILKLIKDEFFQSDDNSNIYENVWGNVWTFFVEDIIFCYRMERQSLIYLFWVKHNKIYYLTYWLQASVVRSSWCHLYIKIQYSGGKTHGWYHITKTTIYTGDTIDNLRYKETRNI